MNDSALAKDKKKNFSDFLPQRLSLQLPHGGLENLEIEEQTNCQWHKCGTKPFMYFVTSLHKSGL